VLLELRTLPDGLAEIVARHLVAADLAMAADDVELAMAHIEAARRRAGRVAAVREAAGVAAYKAGKFPEAISELRTARRMTGSNAFTPMIADCERGLGRPQKALDLIKTTNSKTLDDETRAELLIVGAGARADLGQIEAAVVTLQVPELTKLRPGTARARLQYAYSDFLAQVGRTTEAWEWMERAAASDIDGATDAAERCEEFAGIAFTEEIGSPADPAND
jgi:tetratricopeptide (TPR) repeat protein